MRGGVRRVHREGGTVEGEDSARKQSPEGEGSLMRMRGAQETREAPPVLWGALKGRERGVARVLVMRTSRTADPGSRDRFL